MKFIDSLFRPKLIGKYINEHFMHAVTYLIFFILLCSIPIVTSTLNTPKLDYSSQISLFNTISNNIENKTIEIKDNKLNTTDEYVFSGSNVSIAFNTSKVENSLVFVFMDTYYHVYYNNAKVATIEYESIPNSSFSLNKVALRDYEEIYHFIDILNVGYDKVLNTYIPISCLESIGNIVFDFSFVLILLLFFTSGVNMAIPAKFRFKVCVYAMTWPFVLYFIGINTGATALFYIGVVIAYIFTILALRNLIRVKKE